MKSLWRADALLRRYAVDILCSVGGIGTKFESSSWKKPPRESRTQEDEEEEEDPFLHQEEEITTFTKRSTTIRRRCSDSFSHGLRLNLFSSSGFLCACLVRGRSPLDPPYSGVPAPRRLFQR